jgi:hypothetical protein
MTVESKTAPDCTAEQTTVEVQRLEKDDWKKQNDIDCADETSTARSTTTDPEDDDSSSHEQCDDEPTPGQVAVSGAKKPVPDADSQEEREADSQEEQEADSQEEREANTEEEQKDSADCRQKPAMLSEEDTICIFDWDDTCLPSTWVSGQGLTLNEESIVSESQLQQLDEAAQVVAKTLSLAKRFGTVVLVTNAEKGWIELSCRKFVPNLLPSLVDVRIVSARTTYESASLTSPQDWKYHAFRSELMKKFGEEALHDSERRKNVLSLGDSHHEREALFRAAASLPNCRSKSMKFVERPDISQICKQHLLVSAQFERIVQHDENLDLCIRCS